MPYCRVCGEPFQWGFCESRWVLLELSDSDGDLERSYVDEEGNLRADHRDRHVGGVSINVERLTVKAPAPHPLPPPKMEKEKKKGKKKSKRWYRNLLPTGAK